jgi:hypothetical protein
MVGLHRPAGLAADRLAPSPAVPVIHPVVVLVQRVCMRVAGGKEDGVNEDFAGQSSANFLSSAA